MTGEAIRRRAHFTELYALLVVVPSLILFAAGPLAAVLALGGSAAWRRRQHRG